MSECENNFHLHDNAEGLYGKKNSVKALLGNWLQDIVINSDKNTVIYLYFMSTNMKAPFKLLLLHELLKR